jgi:N-acetyl-gamma-glutamylphosphate reductase
MTFKTVALFGANGQIGSTILRALLNCRKQTFHIIQFIPPGAQSRSQPADNLETKNIDLDAVSRQELASALKGVDVVVSAVNGKALESQGLIQDAAADAGVKRFYPSEYGFHQIYRKPGDPRGYLHPVCAIQHSASKDDDGGTTGELGKETYL